MEAASAGGGPSRSRHGPPTTWIIKTSPCNPGGDERYSKPEVALSDVVNSAIC